MSSQKNIARSSLLPMPMREDIVADNMNCQYPWQQSLKLVMEQPLVLSHLILSTLQFGCVIEQPLSPLSYLFDLINYASLILLNKLSILFHPIIVWPCGQYYKVQGWAHV